MAEARVFTQTTSWFYTAPFEEVAVRRGDPLGLQAVAETVAEALAPGLSNRTVDARWLSILCWCLREAQGAWQAYGNGRDPVGQAAMGKHLYPWVRPLELLWTARTATVAPDEGRGRQLPGIRPIRQWLAQDRRPRNFAFAASSYDQYRFIGSYGGYRAALRSLQGLTENGAGWLPGKRGQALAEIVGAHVDAPAVHLRRTGPVPTAEALWTRSIGWPASGKEFLPTVLSQPKRLEGDERAILNGALFVEKQGGKWQQHALRRRKVAEAVAESEATDRAGLMADLAAALRGEEGLPWLHHLASFAALADAGTGAMNACWDAVYRAPDSTLTAGEVAALPAVRGALKVLVEACGRWERQGSNTWSDRAGKLSQTVLGGSAQPHAMVCRLIQFHLQYGGGLPWLMLDGERIRPVARLRDGDASLYRYRLPALARLARQCGVISGVPTLLGEKSEAALAAPEVAGA